MNELRALRSAIRLLNLRVWWILAGGVDTRAEDWPEKLDRRIPRKVQETLLAAIDLYVRGDAETREAIRKLFRTYDSFTWATKLPFEPDDSEHTFAHLIHFSIVDQGTDPRDARLWLQDLVTEAKVSPEELDRLCNRAADLSSEVDRFQWFGSTAEILRETRPIPARGRSRRPGRGSPPRAC
jgi:hypothetical protein